MMTYVYAYIALGLVTYLASAWASERTVYGLASERQIYEDYFWPLFRFALTVAFWPFAAVGLACVYAENRYGFLEGLVAFKVRRKHLRKAMSVADIEAKEIVMDPLGAVATVPFGYLNPVWVKFREGLEDEDRLVRFEALWTNHQRRQQRERRTGYALVRWGRVRRFFVGEITDVQNVDRK
jgi:hypothetical protein